MNSASTLITKSNGIFNDGSRTRTFEVQRVMSQLGQVLAGTGSQAEHWLQLRALESLLEFRDICSVAKHRKVSNRSDVPESCIALNWHTFWERHFPSQLIDRLMQGR